MNRIPMNRIQEKIITTLTNAKAVAHEVEAEALQDHRRPEAHRGRKVLIFHNETTMSPGETRRPPDAPRGWKVLIFPYEATMSPGETRRSPEAPR